MQQPQDPPPSPSNLPYFALAEVLRHLGQDERLGTCTAVSQHWHEAALTATPSIIKRCWDQQQLSSMLPWLQKHGQHVTKLILHNEIRYWKPSELPTVALPLCANLRDLHLSNFSLNLCTGEERGASSHSLWQDAQQHCNQQAMVEAYPQHPHPHQQPEQQQQQQQQTVMDDCSQQQEAKLDIGALTKLTSLSLRNCTMLQGPTSWPQLAALKGLQHLRLEQAMARGFSHMLPGNWLSQLSQLSSLELRGVTLQPLCGLSSLHELNVRVLEGSPLPDLRDVPQLIKLEVGQTPLTRPLAEALRGPQWQHHGVRLGVGETPLQLIPSRTPWLGQLTTLQCLCLPGCYEVDPGLLSPVKHLQHLHLDTVKLSGQAAGTFNLLSWLQQLQQLTRLQLSIRDTANVPAAAHAYAALTASSRLRTLDLSHMQLPAGVWDHMFARGRMLPNLQKLRLHHLGLDCCASSSTGSVTYTLELGQSSRGRERNTSLMSSSDLQSLVFACPALQQLSLYGLLQPSTPLTPLLQLSALCDLTISGIDVSAQSIGVLAQLTGLSELVMLTDETLSAEMAWMGLSGNTRLLHLHVNGLHMVPGHLISSQNSRRCQRCVS